jgi:cell wall-associated NlpC family hydrolase
MYEDDRDMKIAGQEDQVHEPEDLAAQQTARHKKNGNWDKAEQLGRRFAAATVQVRGGEWETNHRQLVAFAAEWVMEFTLSSKILLQAARTAFDAELANSIVDYAMTFIGVPYVYGGASPSTGFDCSGLTQYVYNHFGYTICRTTQYKEGVPVERDELLPGDLVFFNTTGYGIGHVGMYVGDNQFIHAPSPGKTVCITRMDSSYYNSRFVCAVRII